MLDPVRLLRDRLGEPNVLSLTKLGKYKWLRIVPDENRKSLFQAVFCWDEPSIKRLLETEPDVRVFVQSLMALRELKPVGFCLTGVELYAISRLLHRGPKVVTPTVQQCEVMARAELSVSLNRYQQPFNPLIVQYPREWAQRMAHDQGIPTLQFTILDHHTDLPSIHLAHFVAEYTGGSYLFMVGSSNLDPTMTIEEIAVIVRDQHTIGMEPTETQAADLARRVALNVALLGTNYGVVPVGPAESPHQVQLRAQARRLGQRLGKRARLAARVAREQQLDPRYYAIQQTVPLTRKRIQRDELGGTTHASPRPHWRSGYWRQQPYGPRIAPKYRQIFIPEVFVNSHQFLGTQANTRVRMTD